MVRKRQRNWESTFFIKEEKKGCAGENTDFQYCKYFGGLLSIKIRTYLKFCSYGENIMPDSPKWMNLLWSFTWHLWKWFINGKFPYQCDSIVSDYMDPTLLHPLSEISQKFGPSWESLLLNYLTISAPSKKYFILCPREEKQSYYSLFTTIKL